jgi:hypothetical protein
VTDPWRGTPFEGAEVISSYTRADALRDGELVELPEAICQEAGFRFPVAVTRSVWESCIHWPESESGTQMESGRMWDVLFMGSMAGRRAREASRVEYQLHVVPRGEDARDEGPPPLVTLVLHIGPGDTWEPVITIMQPGED